jgi:hypothetical protein
MNAADIEALVNAKVAAALKPRGYEWGTAQPECRNTQVVYTVAGQYDCYTKAKALECAFEIARKSGRPVEFRPWNVENPNLTNPPLAIKQTLTGCWRNGYDSKMNYPIKKWIFSNPINAELAQDAADGITFIDVPMEGNEQ